LIPAPKLKPWLHGAAAVLLVVFAFFLAPSREKSPAATTSHSAAMLDQYFGAHAQSYCWGNCPKNAQRVCISGDCPCFDEPYQTQCFAERKSSFQASNPPRGELTGVCWANLYKWERDPTTDKQVMRVRSPIYSHVKFNETEVLSTWARDARDAGFEVEVRPAWEKFVKEQYGADVPAGEGWSWSQNCVSLSSPRRNEDREWASAQEQANYQRVFMPTYGIADTPEERALEAKLAAEREAREKARLAEVARQKQIAEAKAAEEARKRAEAEAARQAELARIEAARQAKVDAIAQQIGPGKSAEAERLARMNDQLAALRPKPRPNAQQEQDARAKEAADAQAKQDEAEKAARERREADEKAAAERKRLADAKLAEEKRKKEEANRPIEFKEGVVVCTKQSEKSYRCEGPLQVTYSDLVSQVGRTSVALACGKDSRSLDSIRDLGSVNGYRVFGCGYGIHPNSTYPGNRDVPAAYGLYVSSRATFHCPPSTDAYCNKP
jgi:hypothetical protein